MQYTVTINQAKAQEWGLNAQQAMLFAFVYECPSWCNPVTKDGVVFFALAKTKIVEELPLLTSKPDTAYRMLRALQDKGLVVLSSTREITLIRLTDKAKAWNQKEDGSEKYPSKLGKNSDAGRKKIRGGSEKSPTNQDTSNQDTKNHKPQGASAPTAKAYPEDFEELWFEYPSREGSNPKNHAYQAWKARTAEGATHTTLLNGVRRYAEFCKAKGSVGTSYVMQAKRFFGTSREFENDWTVATTPPAKFGRQSPGRHTGLQAPDTSSLVAKEDGTYEF